MPTHTTVTVSVPATTANIGPGFDCLGAALTLYNQVTFSRLEGVSPLEITVTGDEADRVETSDRNLIYQAFAKFYQHRQQRLPGVKLAIQLGVPLARGLGSSATAIVAGLVGANAMEDFPLSRSEVMNLAIALEGHPDNVVPALVGGCQLAATAADGSWEICPLSWHPTIAAIVAIPNFELSTAEARRVLPQEYSRADAIFNTAHLGLLVRGLETGNPDWLRAALQDRIHQPYRQKLIAGYDAVQAQAIAAGAYGLVISGAGPTLLALADLERAEPIRAAIAQAWSEAGITAMVKVLQIDHQGATTQF